MRNQDLNAFERAYLTVFIRHGGGCNARHLAEEVKLPRGAAYVPIQESLMAKGLIEGTGRDGHFRLTELGRQLCGMAVELD